MLATPIDFILYDYNMHTLDKEKSCQDFLLLFTFIQRLQKYVNICLDSMDDVSFSMKLTPQRWSILHTTIIHTWLRKNKLDRMSAYISQGEDYLCARKCFRQWQSIFVVCNLVSLNICTCVWVGCRNGVLFK